MIYVEVREKFARMKNGGFDRETHDSYGYDVFLVNESTPLLAKVCLQAALGL